MAQNDNGVAGADLGELVHPPSEACGRYPGELIDATRDAGFNRVPSEFLDSTRCLVVQ